MPASKSSKKSPTKPAVKKPLRGAPAKALAKFVAGASKFATKLAKSQKPVAAPTAPASSKSAAGHGGSAGPGASGAKKTKGGTAGPLSQAQLAQAMAKASGSPLPPTRASKALSQESVCREVACEGLATSAGYCRMHYVKNWKKIKRLGNGPKKRHYHFFF